MTEPVKYDYEFRCHNCGFKQVKQLEVITELKIHEIRCKCCGCISKVGVKL